MLLSRRPLTARRKRLLTTTSLLLLLLLGLYHLQTPSSSPHRPLRRHNALSPLSTSTPLHPILILQHDCNCDAYHRDSIITGHASRDVARVIAEHSIAQHRKYAAAHGYGYRLSEGLYVPQSGGLGLGLGGKGWKGKQWMNKVHLVLQVILEEIEKGEEGAEWIIQKDVDTLLTNPTIPLHLLLPPPQTSPDPLLLASQDHNGFNAGVIIWRVGHRAVMFLARMLALEQGMVQPGTGLRVRERDGGAEGRDAGEGDGDEMDAQAEQEDRGGQRGSEHASSPSDQTLIGLLLSSYPDAASGFYEIPQSWLSSYRLDGGDQGGLGGYGPLGDGGEQVQIGVHIAGPGKKGRGWEKCIDIEKEVWARARAAGRELRVGRGDGRGEAHRVDEDQRWMDEVAGIEALGGYSAARKAGEAFWKSAKPGVEGVRFNDI